MGGRLEPSLAEGAAQVGEGTSLLKPAAHTRLDVSVDVPKGGIVECDTCHLLQRTLFSFGYKVLLPVSPIKKGNS